MTEEEQNMVPSEHEADVQPQPQAQPQMTYEYGKALDLVQNTLENFYMTADVQAVYAEPIEHGDTLVIPTAEVMGLLGFGVGEGGGSGPEGQGQGMGGGGGGGGRTFSRPVAVIVVSPNGVEVKPVFDVTKIILAALTTWGFMVGVIARMSRGKRIR
jgi:uncharacterized spore protein YtfJ